MSGAGRDALIASKNLDNPTRLTIPVIPHFTACRPNKIARVAALALLLLAGPGQAQIANLLSAKPKSEAVKAAEAPAAVNPRTEAEKQLAEARRQQEAGRIESGTAPDAEQLPTSEQQRLLDRLVAAYGERLNLMDEADGLRKSAPKLQDRSEQIAEFAGPPPYPALRVDALRDELDLMRDRLKHRTSNKRILENQKQSLIEAQRRAGEALRLAEDKLARAKGEQDSERARKAREIAALRLQLTEAEVINLGIGLQGVQDEIQALELFTKETEGLVARVLPQQKLGKSDVDEQQAKLRATLGKLATELDRRVAANTRRLVEREQLAKSLASRGEDAAANRQLKLFDETLETDRIEMMTLNWMQTVVQYGIDGWGHRYAALSDDDATARASALAALSAIKGEVDARTPLVRELAAAAQAAIDQQEMRLKDALLDTEATARESAISETLKQRLRAIQRVELAGERLNRVLARWLGDFGFSGEASTARDWKLVAARAGEMLKQVWNFELFAVEDSTVVEGKTVTTSYGVTVGKSIGVLFLYVFAYWVCSMLSRRLERILVRRFGVDEQLASVTRRWIMIAVSVVLIVLVLNLARIPLTVFAFMGGALAIGVGFGTQTIIKNVISGIIILFERKIRVGDIVAIGGTTGYVTAVDLRASTVRSFDGVEALVPNSTFLENQVVNWTYSNSRIRREIRIGIAYGSPVRKAAEVIAGCAAEHGLVLDNPPPEVFLEDFSDSAILMALIFWVEMTPTLSGRRVDSDLRFMIEKRLAVEGIRIPFPQRDVHLNVAEAVPIRVMRASEPGG
ncbi:MAG: mechanosensitive ion channel [Dechloromonas sp.]|nr:mechanosensitive ion channel [Dechloromonas sp.]